MSKSRNTLIRQDDFVELKYRVVVRNTTTQTEVRASVPVTISELRPRGVVLRLPAGACMTGHVLLLQILPETNLKQRLAPVGPAETAKGAPVRKTEAAIARSHDQLVREKERAHREFQLKVIEITAKVQGVQVTDDGSLRAELGFYQFDQEKWRRFLHSFEEQQEKIHRIVKAVKG